MAFKQKLASFTVLALLLSLSAPFAAVCAAEDAPVSAGTAAGQSSYAAYREQAAAYPRGSASVSADLDQAQGEGLTVHESFEGRENVLEWANETGELSIPVTVPAEGRYTIRIEYMPLDGKGREIAFGLKLDGEEPFDGAGDLSLNRVWADALDGGEFAEDAGGNQVRPKQEENRRFMTGVLRAYNLSYDDELELLFTAGEHTITLTAGSEAFAISAVTLQPLETLPTYAETIAGAQTGAVSGFSQTYQAEHPLERSHTTLYAVTDRASAATEPSDPARVVLNTVGGQNWKYPGQWLSWEIEVPEDGYYVLHFRARQNFLRGLDSTRRLYIDGKVPFEEANTIHFAYHYDWTVQTAGEDGEPYLFYLTAGKHVLTLEVVLGELAEPVRAVEDATLRMNRLYRSIIMITGNTPDSNRDYYLEDEIPGLVEELAAIRDLLIEQAERLEGPDGSGSEASTLRQAAARLDDFAKKPRSIATRLSQFQESITSLSAWGLSLKEQPLQLDSITVASPEQAPPKAGAGFFRQLWYDVQSFAASFVVDYTTIGGGDGQRETIDVWVIQSGRDQQQILKTLIDDQFTPEHNIGVNLSLVTDTTTLTQAILGGKGPDAAVMVPRDLPVNYACRGALTDLSSFGELEEIRRNYYDSAFVPYQYNGGTYALPETQSFQMLFIRTDVFAELGIGVPETWEEFYRILPFIQRRNMSVGIPSMTGNTAVQTTFETLLFQHGGQLYTEDQKASGLTEPEAVEAFEQWTALYTDYGLPVEFDMFTRFRSGEMPMGIANVSFYNQLSVAAPEIRGQWTMAPLPGYEQEDDTIYHPSGATGNGCILLAGSDQQQEGYTFLKWWTSAQVQAQYGIELENTMGPMARYETANREAFDQLPWTSQEAAIIREQWEQVQDVPQLPGSYFTTRNITFAFRAVVYKGENTKEVLKRYTQEIDSELRRKRLEFGLEG